MDLSHCLVVVLILACASAIIGPGNGTAPAQKTDTYLDAYSKSRIDAEKAKQGVIIVTAKDGEKKITNRDDSFGGYDYTPSYQSPEPFSSSGYSGPSATNTYLPPSGTPIKFNSEPSYSSPSANTYGPPSNNYGPPSNNYGPPASNYGPPTNSYGPPANTYGPPANTYGPPANTYGPPSPSYGAPLHKPAPIYGPPLKPTYGVPYSTGFGFGFLDKLSLKLDILTIAKLLLKLLIFKKIVTMLAVVCMLLVIPKIIEFKKSGSPLPANDEDERRMDHKEVVLRSARDVLDRAISVYGAQESSCGITCRVQRVLEDVYEFEPYFRP